MFALGLGTSLPEKIVCVVMSVSADAFKCVAVLVCLRLWLQRRFVLAGVSCVLGLLCLGWSTLSAMGFALSVRDMTQAAHIQIADQYNGWTAVVRRVGEQLGSVQRHRPEQVIQAELAAQMVPAPIWKRTQACTELTLPESHTACARVLALRQELAAAQSARTLEERIAQARRHLATAPVVGLSADPQVAGLSALLGTEEPTLRRALALLLAVLVEAGSAVGFALAGAATANPPSPPPDRRNVTHENSSRSRTQRRCAFRGGEFCRAGGAQKAWSPTRHPTRRFARGLGHAMPAARCSRLHRRTRHLPSILPVGGGCRRQRRDRNQVRALHDRQHCSHGRQEGRAPAGSLLRRPRTDL